MWTLNAFALGNCAQLQLLSLEIDNTDKLLIPAESRELRFAALDSILQCLLRSRTVDNDPAGLVIQRVFRCRDEHGVVRVYEKIL